ncbi:V-type ATP synthase subunit D [Candidatus Woesearchaeota archaeon]|nr:MAG: V-type ATP synthase subunit D [Candidatus Woesearchaeota archaeon]
MTQNVKPTRSELMILKKKIKLAKSGYNLLKKKRDGLILDFFEILKEAKTLRGELTQLYIEANNKMNMARALESDIKIQSIAMASNSEPEITLDTKNIMGVVVPRIGGEKIIKNEKQRGYGLINVSSAVNESAKAYEKVIQKVVQAAEAETSMKKLLEEIEKTKRRVNALEFEVIPKMENVQAFIKLRLEEMDRENIFRMKRIKA